MKELPVDILEFFFLTPLPGWKITRSWFSAGVKIDRT